MVGGGGGVEGARSEKKKGLLRDSRLNTGHENNIAEPNTAKCFSSPSHLSSFFAV